MDLSPEVKAALMGVVEGLTEFLPVSSTGHLILFGDAIKFTGPSASVFEVVIQMGAILAVLVCYWRRFFNVTVSCFHSKAAQHFILTLLVAFLPAAVIGIFAHQAIKGYLFTPQVVAISLIVGGLVMAAIDFIKIKPLVFDVDRMTLPMALKIGLVQCVAMVPGVSRSGATIIGGVLSGLSRKTAAEFSFFLAVPTLLAAGLYDLYKSWNALSAADFDLILIGFISSFIVGYAVIKIFIQMIVRIGFMPFALYRIALGSFILFSL